MQWRKLGRIFDPTSYRDGIDRPWMVSHAQCASTLDLGDRLRVFFSCRPPPDDLGQATSYTAWLDLDADDLTRVVRVADEPVMALGALGTFDEHAVYPTSVLPMPDHVRLYYAGWSRRTSVPFDCAIGMATSTDGAHFERHAPGPLLGASPLEPFVLSGPKARRFDDRFVLYYLAGREWVDHRGRAEIIYRLRMATSDDGLAWTREDRDIVPTVLGAEECQAGPDVFVDDAGFHMYFAFRQGLDFRTTPGRGYRIGYARSADGLHWERDDAAAGIDLSATGWDSEMQHYPHVFVHRGRHWMLHNGNDFGRGGLGLAVREA